MIAPLASTNMRDLFVSCFSLRLIGVLLSCCLLSPTLRADDPWLAIEDPELGLDLRVWANDGGEKIPKERLQTETGALGIPNSVWDGEVIRAFGARNEIISFTVIVDNNGEQSIDLDVEFDQLSSSNGDYVLATTESSTNALFNWINRPIEVFSVGYLRIHGLSLISYPNDDETHVPEKLRRNIPFNFQPAAPAVGEGEWDTRPDHDLSYPDIAIPREIGAGSGGTTVAAANSQAFWVDVYLPKTAPAGVLAGDLTIKVNGSAQLVVPVEIDVLDFALPDEKNSKTMVYIEPRDVKERYFSGPDGPLNSADNQAYRDVIDRHFMLAWRHGISLFDANELLPDQFPEVNKPNIDWEKRLAGDLYTQENGYAGPGADLPHDIYVVGSYGAWGFWWDLRAYNPRSETYNPAADPAVLEATLIDKTSLWETWFQENAPDVRRFLYVDDEPGDETEFANLVAGYVEASPLAPSNLDTFVTADSVFHGDQLDNVSILASLISAAPTQLWEDAIANNSHRAQYMYNGRRPASGTFAIEDDGIALRELSWGQYKKNIERWFYWHSTYYNNTQAGPATRDLSEVAFGEGESYRLGSRTNVFKSAHTFGGHSRFDIVDGETGFNYGNGDGLLFYPGTDMVFPAESLGVNGPIASLRLKHWRRGIQDIEYVLLAMEVAPAATQAIVDEMVPQALWEIGVADPGDPTFVNLPPSWSNDPDDWETARRDLADLILDAAADARPAILSQPEGLTATSGESISLEVVASSDTSLTYQWLKDGDTIVGATESVLTITFIQETDEGDYVVEVSNAAGTTISDTATVIVDPAPEAPVFTLEPLTQTVVAGTDITLTGDATGVPAPTYQWQKDTQPLAGETNPSLTLTAIEETDAGSYTLVATNSEGSVSSTAVITVDPATEAPIFTLEPLTQTVVAGTDVTLTGEATGVPTPTYQWQKDGQQTQASR